MSEEVARALDARHDAARDAFLRRDLAAYGDFFTADLDYEQPDDRVMVRREAHLRDVARQFRRTRMVGNSYTREALEMQGGEAVETLAQMALVTTSAFGLLHREWRLDRRAIYTWRQEDGAWRIRRVRILENRVTPSRLRLGWY